MEDPPLTVRAGPLARAAGRFAVRHSSLVRGYVEKRWLRAIDGMRAKLLKDADFFDAAFHNFFDGKDDQEPGVSGALGIVVADRERKALASMVGLVTNMAESLERKDDDWYLPYHFALWFLCRAFRPRTVIETGVERGGSTLMLLEALSRNAKAGYRGVLHSFDISAKFHGRLGIGLAPAVPEEMRGSPWQFHHGDTKVVLADWLDQIGFIEMFVHGSDHGFRTQLLEIQQGWRALAAGGVMVVDRPDYNGYKALDALVLDTDSPPRRTLLLKESMQNLPYDFAVLLK